jgi:hypothetical protein
VNPGTPSHAAIRRALIATPILIATAVSVTSALTPSDARATDATTRQYRAVQVTSRSAKFAVSGLAGRSVVSAHLTASGGRSRHVATASVRRAATGTNAHGRLLRLWLPPSWRSAPRARRMTLHVRIKARPQPASAAPSAGSAPSAPSGTSAQPETVVASSPGSSAPAGNVLWKADAESSMAAEWASSSSIPKAASPPSPDPTRIGQSTFRAQGKRSYRFEMRNGDDSYGERAELGQGMPTTSAYQNRWFRAGDERWIAMQYYFPADWPTDDTWQSVFQIKPVDGGGGGPNLGFDAGRNRLMFAGNNNVWGSTAGNLYDGIGPLPGGSYPLVRGSWIKVTWHVVFSANPSVGSLEVFGDLADGKGMRTLVPRRPRATMKFLGSTMDPAHLRVGIYRDPGMTATQSLYVDGVTVATTRAAAEANAYATG